MELFGQQMKNENFSTKKKIVEESNFNPIFYKE